MKAIAAALLVVTSMTAQAAEPTTLTLACQGTVIKKTDPSSDVAKPEPVSMGLMIDFTSNTVAGFERVFRSFDSTRVEITIVDKTTIEFRGMDEIVGDEVHGTLDRITGDMKAAMEFRNHVTGFVVWAKVYALKCRPTQRMF